MESQAIEKIGCVTLLIESIMQKFLDIPNKSSQTI